MSITTQRNGADDQEFVEPLGWEYFTVPRSWANQGKHPDLVEEIGEERYYATQVCHESFLRGRRVSPRETDFSEFGYLWVKYVRGDGERAVERRDNAAVIKRDGELVVVPKQMLVSGAPSWSASIGVRPDEGREVPVDEHDIEVLAERYGIEVR